MSATGCAGDGLEGAALESAVTAVFMAIAIIFALVDLTFISVEASFPPTRVAQAAPTPDIPDFDAIVQQWGGK